MSQSICRHFMLQIALKCADISNPCRNWNISRLWSYRACEEFYRQGDRERELELPVTPICDRSNISVAKVSFELVNQKNILSKQKSIYHTTVKGYLKPWLLFFLMGDCCNLNSRVACTRTF